MLAIILSSPVRHVRSTDSTSHVLVIKKRSTIHCSGRTMFLLDHRYATIHDASSPQFDAHRRGRDTLRGRTPADTVQRILRGRLYTRDDFARRHRRPAEHHPQYPLELGYFHVEHGRITHRHTSNQRYRLHAHTHAAFVGKY